MRVGLVGCGNIGKVHAMAIARMEQAGLCAFADIQSERAKSYADQFTEGKAAVYRTLEEMMDQEELEVVHICTPHACHVPMAVTALKKGLHVFVEKPPAINREEFQQLKQTVEESSGTLGVCFQNRYNKSTKKVDELIAAGNFGKIRGGRAFVTWNRNAPYYTESGWRGSLETEGGGVLINQSIHNLDLLLRWMGKPVSVEASMQNHHLKGYIEVEDTLEAYLTFEEGSDPVRASFYATNAFVSDEPVFLELIYEHGSIRIEGSRVWHRDAPHSIPVFWQDEAADTPGKAYWGNGHEACILDFYRCLRSGAPYANDLASVTNTFETVMQIYDSARTIKSKRGE